MPRIDRAKKRTRQRIASAHPVEQSRRPDVRSHTRAKIGHHQGHSDDGEQRTPHSSRGPHIGRIRVRKRLGCRPDKRKNADYHASQHRGQHDIAPRIFSLFRQSRDAVETYVRQHRNRSAPEQIAHCESLRIVERPREEMWIAVRMAEDVSNRADEDHYHYGAHSRGQARVYSRRSLDPPKIQQRKRHRENDFPAPIGYRRCKLVRLARAPNYAYQWIHDVIHHHAPTGHIPDRRMDFLRHVCEC